MPSIPANLECIQAGDPHALTHCLHLQRYALSVAGAAGLRRGTL